MSNLADFLNDVGVNNADAFDGLEDAIGTLSDVIDGVLPVVGFIGIAIKLFGGGPDELQQVESAIQALFKEQQQDQKAKDLIDQLTNLQNVYLQADGRAVDKEPWGARPPSA